MYPEGGGGATRTYLGGGAPLTPYTCIQSMSRIP